MAHLIDTWNSYNFIFEIKWNRVEKWSSLYREHQITIRRSIVTAVDIPKDNNRLPAAKAPQVFRYDEEVFIRL